MALRSIGFTSNHKEKIILPCQAQAKNVNMERGLHPEEESARWGFPQLHRWSKSCKTRQEQPLIPARGCPSRSVVGWDKPCCSRWVLFPSEPSHGPAQVLRSCAAVPEVIEVLFNSYSQIRVCQEWAKAVPQEVFQVRQHCWFGRVSPQSRVYFPHATRVYFFPTQQGFIFSPTQTSLGWRKIKRNIP